MKNRILIGLAVVIAAGFAAFFGGVLRETPNAASAEIAQAEQQVEDFQAGFKLNASTAEFVQALQAKLGVDAKDEHSWLLLAATLLALFLTYLLPVVLLFADDAVARWLGVGALLLMSWCYLPMIRFYELFPLWSVGLPVIAAFYLGAVIHSAVQHARGRGGRWKGRVQDGAD